MRTGPLVVLALLAACGRPPEDRLPHVVLFLADTLRADVLGVYGGDPRTSEHLSEIAAGGALFLDCRASSPWTLPSMGSIFTGLYPRSHGAGLSGPERNLYRKKQPTEWGRSANVPKDGRRPQAVAGDVATLGALFADAGYATYLRSTTGFLGYGLDAGFEVRHQEQTHAGAVVDWALEQLAAREDDRPVFMVLHVVDTHTTRSEEFDHLAEDLAAFPPDGRPPLDAADRSWTRYDDDPALFAPEMDRRRWMYAVCARYVDRQVGRLHAALADLGEPSVLAFTSDHGEDFRDHWEVDHASGHTDPRRDWEGLLGIGHGHNLHGSLTRVPLIVAGAGVPAGARVEQRVGLVDVLPTLCDLAGMETPPGVQGRSLVPLMRGATPRPPPYLSESLAYGREKTAFFAPDDWLLVLPGSPREEPQLFDLSSDPDERRDLAGERPEQLERLRAAYADFAAALEFRRGGDERLDDAARDALEQLGYLGDDR